VSIGPDSAANSGLGTKVAAGAAGLVLLVAVLAAGAGAGIASLLGGGATPSATATAQVPATMLALYQEAAATCAGLPWTVLAAISTVESDNGTSNLPRREIGPKPLSGDGAPTDARPHVRRL